MEIYHITHEDDRWVLREEGDQRALLEAANRQDILDETRDYMKLRTALVKVHAEGRRRRRGAPLPAGTGPAGNRRVMPLLANRPGWDGRARSAEAQPWPAGTARSGRQPQFDADPPDRHCGNHAQQRQAPTATPLHRGQRGEGRVETGLAVRPGAPNRPAANNPIAEPASSHRASRRRPGHGRQHAGGRERLVEKDHRRYPAARRRAASLRRVLGHRAMKPTPARCTTASRPISTKGRVKPGRPPWWRSRASSQACSGQLASAATPTSTGLAPDRPSWVTSSAPSSAAL